MTTQNFKKLGPAVTFEHTISIEAKFQKQLNRWVKSGLLSLEISDRLDLFVPVFMVYLKSINMVFLCDLSFLWWVLPNKFIYLIK